MDAQIMNRGNRLNEGIGDANWTRRNLVLPSAGGAPENLSLGRVQLQWVSPYPGSDIVSTPGKAVSKGRDIRRFTGTVNWSIISIIKHGKKADDA
jgi:hypothetical protein